MDNERCSLLGKQGLHRNNGAMPNVSIGSGVVGPDGQEERITEYLCDSPNCPNVATQMVGCVTEIPFCVALCDEHAGQLPRKL
jgi:hypothetical protein